jgi:hypothetical protein
MTNKKINIAIAEACGWRIAERVSPEAKEDATACWIRPNGDEWQEESLPDYCNDLNAMREAMLTLTNKQGFGFLWHLNDMGFVGGDWELLTLDSRVLAEAFLRTIEKWEGAE